MKLTGFIRQHDNIFEGRNFNQMFCLHNADEPLREKTINYLNQGMLVMGWMSYVADLETHKTLCPASYFTDGFWVWPEYYMHYLKRIKNFFIDPEFILHLEAKDFNNDVNKMPAIDINHLKSELLKKFRAK